MVRDACLATDSICIHSITPKGGAGKSEFNNEDIDIYERFKFNIKNRWGIATTVIPTASYFRGCFAPEGIIVYDGKVNNIDDSDAGSWFNDKTKLWECEGGIKYPKIQQIIPIVTSAKTYPELNVYGYKICGFFIDVRTKEEEFWLKQYIRSFEEFHEQTSCYDLPYYALSDCGYLRLRSNNLKIDVEHVLYGAEVITPSQIYSEDAKTI